MLNTYHHEKTTSIHYCIAASIHFRPKSTLEWTSSPPAKYLIKQDD